LAQGKTRINGPHQGAWVDTPIGESWFIHFQDRRAYGRIVHLQPMKWVNDWPVIGVDLDGDATGEPVLSFQKPKVGRTYPVTTPQDSDEFNESSLGLQWQWHANPQPNWAFPSGAYGFLRLLNVPLPKDFRNFWDVPNLLLQKFPAPSFTATTKVTFTALNDNDMIGLIVMGLDYAYGSARKRPDGLYVSQAICKDADQQTAEKHTADVRLTSSHLFLRVSVSEDALCNFSYSVDGKTFSPLGESFSARQGKWIGAKVGIFAVGSGDVNELGYADFDWFRVH
jgi:beta-xylosidase